MPRSRSRSRRNKTKNKSHRRKTLSRKRLGAGYWGRPVVVGRRPFMMAPVAVAGAGGGSWFQAATMKHQGDEQLKLQREQLQHQEEMDRAELDLRRQQLTKSNQI